MAKGRNILQLSLVALFGGFSAPILASATQAAATFTVTVTTDLPDRFPGDGKCRTVSNSCSLRAAIMEANELIGADEIVLPSATFKLTRDDIDDTDDTDDLDDLDIRASLTIRGAGIARTIIDAQGIGRVFEVHAPAVVTISGLRIEGGRVTRDRTGAGVANSGRLVLNKVVVRRNTGAESGSAGGGIHNVGTLTITDSTISSNVSASGSGGILNSSGRLTVRNSTIVGNAARGFAGGIGNFGGTVILSNSTVRDNTAVFGGGIANRASLNLNNATISGNKALEDGGGVHLDGSAKATIRNTTITGNFADSDLDGTGDGGGVWSHDPSTFTFINSIIADNNGSQRVGRVILHRTSDCSGEFISAGTNILRAVETANCTITGASTNGPDDKTLIAAPELDPLRRNGGPTATHALQGDSPAVDGSTNRCPKKDQRGRARADGDGNGTIKCDIGSYEFSGPVIRSVSPRAAKAGGPGFTLTVTGIRFQRGARVQWDQSNRPTTFVSSTQLKATIPNSDIAVARTVEIEVLNPRPTNLSAPRLFSVQP